MAKKDNLSERLAKIDSRVIFLLRAIADAGDRTIRKSLLDLLAFSGGQRRLDAVRVLRSQFDAQYVTRRAVSN